MNNNKQLDFDKLQDDIASYRTTAAEAAKKASELENKLNITKQDYQNLLAQQRMFMDNKNASDTVYFNNTYSTTQFFNGSLAKDVFPNSGGNNIPWFYKTFARKCVGLNTQGNTAYDANSPLGGNANNTINNNPSNGTGVGWNPDGDKLTSVLNQKWWAWWVFQLATITKLSGLVEFKCEDVKLWYKLYLAYQLAILCGHSLIRKVDDKYAVYCAYNVEYDEFQEPIKCIKSDATWFFTNTDIPSDDMDSEIDLQNNDEYILLTWDINNYNVWFYTVFYTIDFIDLVYIWLNRAFISRALIFQLVGSSGASKTEAEQLMNPINTVIQIRTAGLEQALDNVTSPRPNEFSIENKYKYLQLGDATADSIFSAFPKIWLNIWDSILGIVPPNNKLDSTRSITDEVLPNKEINKILQMKYGIPLKVFCDEVKKKWNIEVSYAMMYEQEEKEQKLEDASQKQEQGGHQDEVINTEPIAE